MAPATPHPPPRPTLLLSIIALLIAYALLNPPRHHPAHFVPSRRDHRSENYHHNSDCPPLQKQPPSPPTMPGTSWFQKTITLSPRSRGSYLVTSEITSSLPEISQFRVGLLTLFVQHTSCALSLNENYDPDVREDMIDALDRIVPADGAMTWGPGGSGGGRRGAGKSSKEGGELKGVETVKYRHDAEGEDDMPAHVKSSLIGATVTVPITNGELALGTWQGVYYLEFRKARHTRRVVATIQGERME